MVYTSGARGFTAAVLEVTRRRFASARSAFKRFGDISPKRRITGFIHGFKPMVFCAKADKLLIMLVGIGFSSSREYTQAAKEAVAQARTYLMKKIDLALVFASPEFAHPLVLKTVRSLAGEAPLLGASSLAVISRQGISTHGLAVMLLSLSDDAYFSTAYVNQIEKNTALASGRELGEKLLFGFKGLRRNVGVVFSDGLMSSNTDFIAGLQERLGRSFPLIGGSASDNLTFERTHVFYNDEVFSDGACGLVLGGKMSFGFGVQHGWKPLGKIRSVSSSYGNIVTEIDNAPAVKLYEDYFGKSISELKGELKRISILYPVGIKIPEVKEYLLRNIISVKGDRAMVFQGDVPQGSSIRLMIGTKESCQQAARHALQEAKNGLSGRTVKCALIFSSASRFSLLGRQIKEEWRAIVEELGNEIPLLGMYTYGEQAPLGALSYLGKTYSHNHTMTVLCIGE